MSSFDRAHTTSYSTLIETMRLSCNVFEILPAICQKLQILTNPTCIWHRRRGWPPVKFHADLWHQKTRVPRLSCGVVCMILRLAVLTQYRLVTNRRTVRQRNRQTHDDSIYSTSIASCSKNWSGFKWSKRWWVLGTAVASADAISHQTDNHTITSSLIFYRPDAVPGTQPTVSKHWRQTIEC